MNSRTLKGNPKKVKLRIETDFPPWGIALEHRGIDSTQRAARICELPRMAGSTGVQKYTVCILVGRAAHDISRPSQGFRACFPVNEFLAPLLAAR